MAAPTNSICHVVAIPYPGRGHINPMMNLCKLLSLRRPSHFLITFVLTEEWLGLIGSDPKPPNIRLASIPNVIPSEVNRGADFTSFFISTNTNLEEPVRQLIQHLDCPPNLLIYDAYLSWGVSLGNRMNIPVASFFPMSATVFSLSHHYHLLVQNGHVGDHFSEKIEERVNYIPGVSPIRVADLVTVFNGKGKEVMPWALKSISMASKAHFLLLGTVYELETHVIDALRSSLSTPIYSIGLLTPCINFHSGMENAQNALDEYEGSDKNVVDKFTENANYIKWLDHQPKASVLYISQGSFLSVSSAQLEEIIAGVHDSGVRYLWVARGEMSLMVKRENGDKGLVIPWCDQISVLCHGSIGAFWSHCGWNSTKESALSGVPMLTFPIFWDQVPNSKMIVEDWKMGKRVMKKEGILVTREEITKYIKSCMDMENEQGKEMRKRAGDIKKICEQAMAKKGSAQNNLDSFIKDLLSLN